jgi:phospholipid/cholesterol/gamma-HCH transport system substrate-binding protein
MIGPRFARRRLVLASCVLLASTGCAFHGLNSLPLPGTAGSGSDANTYRVEVANAGALESNSPVMIDDVVVGSVGKMTFTDWHADIEFSVRPDVIVPANAVASIGQTSLLGSMHLALDPPLGQAPEGRLAPGQTLSLNESSTYPSTERTLSSLSAVVNGGGLGQIGDIIHNFNAALSGREGDIRDLLTRLDTFVGTLDAQRDNIIASIQALNRLASTFAGQRDLIDQALQKIPPALDVLNRERPRITTALDKLRAFSDTTTGLVNDAQADLLKNLHNLEPTIRALADIGPGLDTALAYAPTFPFGQEAIDRQVRGDYINLFVTLDLTVPRLKRSLLLGTRWADPDATLVPAPGEPYYLNYSYDPLTAPLNAPPPSDGAPPPGGTTPALGGTALGTGPVLPVAPAGPPPPAAQPSGAPSTIFAGPYGGPPPRAETPPNSGGE